MPFRWCRATPPKRAKPRASTARPTDAFSTAVRRTKARSVLVAFIIIATSAALLWGLYQGTQAVMRGDITAGHLGQTVVYVIILASAAAVLGEVYGDLLRAAGATERLMELLETRSPVTSPSNPVPAPVARAGSAIKFEAVTFHYPSRPTQPALSDFSLSVAPGETVAIVGPERRGQEHGVPAAAALLRPGLGPDRAGRRARRATWRCTTCAGASASCRRTR